MKKIHFAILFWLYVLVLTVYSIVPTAGITEKYGFGGFELRLDYWLHLGAYFGVAFLYILWQINNLLQGKKYIKQGFLICLVYAYLTEIIQLFVPGRAYNIYDFVANLSGIVLAFVLFFVFRKSLKQLIFLNMKKTDKKEL